MSCSRTSAIEEPQDLRLHRDVERRGRLVGDQQVGPPDQRHGDQHALAHAARELVRIVVEARLRRPGCRRGRASRPRAGAPRARALAARRRRRRRRESPDRARRRAAPRRSSGRRSGTTGLRLVVGSWKIMPMRRPRSPRISVFRRGEQVPPLEADLPREVARRRGRHEARDRQAGQRLAAAGLADERPRSRRARPSGRCRSAHAPRLRSCASRGAGRGSREAASPILSAAPWGRARRAGRRRAG